MFKLHDLVMGLTVGSNKTFSDLCLKSGSGGCIRGGFLNFWNYNFRFNRAMHNAMKAFYFSE